MRQHKDQDAFKELLSEHGSKLHRFLVLKLPTYQDAEDAFSITSLRIWNYISSSEVESFSGLIYTIGRGVVAEFYRTNAIETVSTDEETNVHSEGESKQGGTQMIAEADVALLKEAIRKLSEDQQIAVMMRYFEGSSIHKIAEVLGRNESATRVFLHRTIKELRKLFPTA